MSVTFRILNSPTKVIENVYFDPEEPEHVYMNPRTLKIDVWPTINISNTYARFVLGLLELETEELCGEVEPKDFEELLKNINLNIETVFADIPTISFRNVMTIGRSSHEFRRYFIKLKEIVLKAKEENQSFVWS